MIVLQSCLDNYALKELRGGPPPPPLGLDDEGGPGGFALLGGGGPIMSIRLFYIY